MHQHTIIIICGPTAVGKTAAAVELARELKTEIISADSRQCFKELNIGVAKPSEAELSTVRHHFINSHSIDEEVNAAIFERYALQASKDIFKKSPISVMVGGTGLYIKAFTEGIDPMPPVDPAVRNEIIHLYEQYGLEYLQQKLSETDPVYWEVAERQNPHRLIRALEIKQSSGRSITTFQKGKKESRPFNIIKVGLELPREQLYEQINARVDIMIENGLVEEVFRLLPHRDKNALQTVGYREIIEFADGAVSLDNAITNIKTNTRHYAKRQMTWFKRDPDINWFNPRNEGLLQSIFSLYSQFNESPAL